MRNATVLRLFRGFCIGSTVYAAAIASSCGGGGSASGNIDSSGGTVSISGGVADGASVTIPMNALSSQTNITLTLGGTPDGLPPGAVAVGPMLVAGPEGQMFSGYVGLRLPTTSPGMQVVTRAHNGGANWTVVPGAVVDPHGGAMLASVEHFSDFVPITSTADAGTCPAPNTMCGMNCVDTTSDSMNCHSCGNVCMGSSTCHASACTCGTGQTYCPATGCENLTTDPMNCSGCGFACSTGQVCVLGLCRAPPMCTAGQTLCGSNCVVLATDNFNCGACGNQCLTGGMCMSGMCTGGMGCPPPTVPCGSQCQDITSDPNNCGTCGHICASGQSCVSSMCM